MSFSSLELQLDESDLLGFCWWWRFFLWRWGRRITVFPLFFVRWGLRTFLVLFCHLLYAFLGAGFDVEGCGCDVGCGFAAGTGGGGGV